MKWGFAEGVSTRPLLISELWSEIRRPIDPAEVAHPAAEQAPLTLAKALRSVGVAPDNSSSRILDLEPGEQVYVRSVNIVYDQWIEVEKADGSASGYFPIEYLEFAENF